MLCKSLWLMIKSAFVDLKGDTETNYGVKVLSGISPESYLEYATILLYSHLHDHFALFLLRPKIIYDDFLAVRRKF